MQGACRQQKQMDSQRNILRPMRPAPQRAQLQSELTLCCRASNVRVQHIAADVCKTILSGNRNQFFWGPFYWLVAFVVGLAADKVVVWVRAQNVDVAKDLQAREGAPRQEMRTKQRTLVHVSLSCAHRVLEQAQEYNNNGC